jgi:hypothetical protein
LERRLGWELQLILTPRKNIFASPSLITELKIYTQPQLYAIVAFLKMWIKSERHKSNIIFPSEVRV